MENRFGPVQFRIGDLSIRLYDYYCEEMGNQLIRSFVSFENPVPPDSLRVSKLVTNEMERRYLNENGGRLINIDPGWLVWPIWFWLPPKHIRTGYISGMGYMRK